MILKESRSQAKQNIPTSTVGRSKSIKSINSTEIKQDSWSDELINVCLGDSLNFYEKWDIPTVIISDGAYGVLGFEGDTSDHLDLPNWFRPHIVAWSAKTTPSTTLWFWNSEIGWASVHPVLEEYGWRYVNANIWNKGKSHIAGNVNTNRIRRFPVVTEICVQYVYEACGVADAAVRKYFDQGHVWYFPPPEMFLRLQEFANTFGKATGRPYFSIDGKRPGTIEQWSAMRTKFKCPYGFTNVWSRTPLHGAERCRTNGRKGKAVHLNQKPLDLIRMIIDASSDEGDVIWEPFGGLFTACIAARMENRRSFSGEIDPTYFHYGVQRIIEGI